MYVKSSCVVSKVKSSHPKPTVKPSHLG